MGLNSTPSGERVHIGIFGRRNAGKSSLINALTNQKIAIVSEVRGTTTDPVAKSMELLPLGPVTIIDTAGIDDSGELGEERVKASYKVLNKTDIAVIAAEGKALSAEDIQLIERIKAKEIPYVIAYTKCDEGDFSPTGENEIAVSALNGHNINELRELIAASYRDEENKRRIVGDLVKTGDIAVLVVPIDKAAPKGRLILPQQQTIRDLLDSGAIAVVTRDTELKQTLASLGKKPAVVITDSQAFKQVSAETPTDIKLTSFSILMARYKGVLPQAVEGAYALNKLNDGDKVLISEGCSHHRQCGDIGTQKLPMWIENFTGKKPCFEFTSGTEFPEELGEYKLIVHCGGCMLNEREMKYRRRLASEQNIPMTNYGILIAYMNGILERSIEIIPEMRPAASC